MLYTLYLYQTTVRSFSGLSFIFVATNYTQVLDNIKNKILVTARNLFATYGFNGTSMRQISKEADVSLSMINYHYKSKVNLLQEIINQLFERFTANLEQIVKQDIDDWKLLNEFLEGMFNINDEGVLTVIILENEIKILKAEKNVYETLVCVDDRIRKLFSQVLNKGYKTKSFKKYFEDDYMCSILFGIMHELIKEVAEFVTDSEKIIQHNKEIQNLKNSKLKNTQKLFKKIIS